MIHVELIGYRQTISKDKLLASNILLYKKKDARGGADVKG